MLTSILLSVSVLTIACKSPAGGGGADSGPVKKFICKMNQQCWICPDDSAMKKCIINPATSGCTQSTSGDCS